jgi:hypothetical protein
LLAAAIFGGFALVSTAVVFSTTYETDRYANAEEIVTAWIDASAGEEKWRPLSVRRISGPFVVVRFKDGTCGLIDVSTQYENGEFWGVYSDGKNAPDC